MYNATHVIGETIDFKFVTTEPDTGAPATLSGTPAISAYVGNSVTQLTAGITLSADFDSVTGLNNVRVVATTGNGYAADTDVALVITTGTVDGNSAVGYVVGHVKLVPDPGVIHGTAQTGTLSTTVMTTDLTGYGDEELIGRVVVFTGGTADGQAAKITDYASTSGTVTYQEIPTAPANGDPFVIV